VKDGFEVKTKLKEETSNEEGNCAEVSHAFNPS